MKESKKSLLWWWIKIVLAFAILLVVASLGWKRIYSRVHANAYQNRLEIYQEVQRLDDEITQTQEALRHAEKVGGNPYNTLTNELHDQKLMRDMAANGFNSLALRGGWDFSKKERLPKGSVITLPRRIEMIRNEK